MAKAIVMKQQPSTATSYQGSVCAMLASAMVMLAMLINACNAGNAWGYRGKYWPSEIPSNIYRVLWNGRDL